MLPASDSSRAHRSSGQPDSAASTRQTNQAKPHSASDVDCLTSDSRLAKRQKTDSDEMFRRVLQQRRAFPHDPEFENPSAIHAASAPTALLRPHPDSSRSRQHHTLDVGISILQGNRQYQEDTYALLSTERLSMVAVYDGHGGSLTSEALQQRLLAALRDALEPVLERNGGIRHVCAAIRDTFLQVNTSLCTGDKNVVSDGSTAAVLVICKVNGRLLAISANAGDSRITLGAGTSTSSSGRGDSSSPSSTRKPSGASRGPLSRTPANRPGRVRVADLDASSGDDESSFGRDGEEDVQIECLSDGEASAPHDSPLPACDETLSDATAATSGDEDSVGAGGKARQRSSFAVRLSCDHDLEHNLEEVARIRAAGGVLVRFQRNGPLRVLSHAGGLNMSRAFGDVAYHGLVIAEPFISVTAIEQPAEFIVIATDGLWGVMEDEEAVAYVHALFHYDRSKRPSPLPSPKARPGASVAAHANQRVTAADTATSTADAAVAASSRRPPAGDGASLPVGSSGLQRSSHRDASGGLRSSSPTRRAMACATGFSARQAANLLQREAARRWAARCPGQQDNTTVAVLRFCWSSPPSPPPPAVGAAAAEIPADMCATMSAPL